MNTKHLEYVLEIYRQKSFTKAAKKLKIAQPSLSQYIATLERQLGFEIFNRATTPVSPTHLGEIFINTAEEMTAVYEGFCYKLNALKGEDRLRIGVSQIGMDFLVKALKRLYEIAPDTQIEIVEERTNAALARLIEENAADFCILAMPSNLNNIGFDLIYEQRLNLVVNKDSALAKKHRGKNKKISLSELENERFIIPKDAYFMRSMINELFRDSNFNPRQILEINNVAMMISCVINGIGVCFGSKDLIKPCEQAKISLLDFEDLVLTRRLILGYPNDKRLSDVALKFLSIARNLIKQEG